jgi:ATP-dependent helicase/nuclease subunit B
LYGSELSLSVSGLESFAACPFQFFAARGLKAEERDEFAVDSRRAGEFQHAVLQAFHRRLLDTGRRWREFTPDEAAQWVREIGAQELQHNQHGLFAADPARTFLANALLGNLQQLIAQLTDWARAYAFEPAAIEVGFGLGEDTWPAWRMELEQSGTVNLRGRVDRVDLCRLPEGRALVAIMDYKSGGKEFKALKFANGLELQMPAYLNAIVQSEGARQSFQVREFIPAGVFYVGLRPKAQSVKNRTEAEQSAAETVRTSFQHRGRFDAAWVDRFVEQGEATGQFKYRFTKNGEPYKTGSDAIRHAEFEALLSSTTQQVRSLAGRILSGEATVSPYKLGGEVACDRCAFRTVCRFDPWVQTYRVLRKPTEGQNA